jgi:CRISPR/Cas system CSM-associated protein Csm2 small subunit
MDRDTLADRDELRQRLLEHVQREGAELAEKLTGVFGELVDKRDPVNFEHRFVEVIHAFGAGMMGQGLKALEPEAKDEVKRGATR